MVAAHVVAVAAVGDGPAKRGPPKKILRGPARDDATLPSAIERANRRSRRGGGEGAGKDEGRNPE